MVSSMLNPMKEGVFNNTDCRIGFQAGTIINHGQINTTDGQYSSEKLKSRKYSVLQKLYKTPYQEHKDRNPDRVPGTCEWFVTHKHFLEWKESKSKSLWVSADPGCGKSVLAKYLIDSILTNTKYRTTCYFFFKDDVENQKSVINAICCILHQLFNIRKELFSEAILEEFETGGENFISSFTALWGALLNVAKSHNSITPPNEAETKNSEIVCILDAIDECESSGRMQLVKALRKLDGIGSALNLKFLLISRPYSEIKHGLLGARQPQVIHLSGESEEEAEKISREIDIFIKARVEDIGLRHQLELEDEELLLQKLMDIPNRTYLWVYLTLDLIETDIYTDNIEISEAITRVSRTVDEAYERILHKSRNFEKAKKLLQIVVAAVRPLSPAEMCIALAIKDNHQSCSDLRLEPEARFRDHIRELCGFLIIIKDSRIYLLHQTVKEFLVQNHQVHQSAQVSPASSGPVYNRISNSTNGYPGPGRQCSFKLQDSHLVLANICIQYLLFKDFEDHPLEGNEMLDEYVKKNGFLDYSAKHWTTHFHESKTGLDQIAPEFRANESETESILRLCDANSRRSSTWFRIYWTTIAIDFPGNFTAMMTTSYFGLTAAVIRLLETDTDQDIDLDFKDDTHQRSALSWAAGNGFDHVVELLLGGIGGRWKNISLPFRAGATVDSLDERCRTPLVHAILNGHVGVVDLLLKGGAAIDIEDSVKGTPLAYGFCSGHNEIAELVSKKGAKTNLYLEEGQLTKLLFSAALDGQESIFELVLKTGKVDPNSRDIHGRAPLSYAASCGYDGIIRLLLETGKVDPDLKDNDERTPFSYAVDYGQNSIIELLLATNKVDPDAGDINGRTPLSYAAERGQEAIVKLLLETGKADPDACTRGNPRGNSPLYYAVLKGNAAIIKLLHPITDRVKIEHHSETYNKDKALLAAVKSGQDDIVRLLLEMGKVNPTFTDENQDSPLYSAIVRKNEAVLELLLNTGKFHLDEDIRERRTPISFAVGTGNVNIVRILLKAGASPNKETHPELERDYLPLSQAAYDGNVGIVKLLLEHGAQPDLKDYREMDPEKFMSYPKTKFMELRDIIRLLDSYSFSGSRVCLDLKHILNRNKNMKKLEKQKKGGITFGHRHLKKQHAPGRPRNYTNSDSTNESSKVDVKTDI
ncbi:hypothetical protein TWF506_000836 [Arthrobotrys conoides]|uniref:NACHT domain-containing protein n=1 Tax=Arthrobotrys conoides TaxID=74498 RepID=A0AAN8NGC4_9PEZI